MSFLNELIYFSSVSFLAYGVSYFLSPYMKNEFKRFGLAKFALFTVVLEILGAIGLLVGLFFHSILIISSGGLTLLMLLGLLVRIRIKDSFWKLTPALFFMVLNSLILFLAF